MSHRLRAVGEHVQVHRRVGVGGAVEHRTDQARPERGQHLHCRQCRLPHAVQEVGVRFAGKQLQILAHRLLDLGITGQRTAIPETESLGRLFLGEAVIANTLVDYDARGFLRNQQARAFAVVGLLLWHRPRTASLPSLRLPRPRRPRHSRCPRRQWCR